MLACSHNAPIYEQAQMGWAMDFFLYQQAQDDQENSTLELINGMRIGEHWAPSKERAIADNGWRSCQPAKHVLQLIIDLAKLYPQVCDERGE